MNWPIIPYRYLVALVVFFLVTETSMAQLSFTGQLRTRSEWRHGQGTLPAPDAKASLFTSQRTRLNLGYQTDRYRFFLSGQEVRVWGADQSTISNLEGNKLFMHQAWGEFILSDTTHLRVENLSVKIGRQEIMYDDARLLGNLDWLQQARRHEAIVIKFNHNGWIADAGMAFNQNHGKDTPGKSGNIYNGVPATPVVPGTNGIGTMYKAMQYGYFARASRLGKVSLLVFKDDFQKTETINGLLTPVEGVNSRVTVGGAFFSKLPGSIQVNAAAYYQGNNDRFGNKLDAHNLTADVVYTAGKFSFNPGVDYLSGNSTTDQGTVNRRFDPLYGTPHKFWGLMDYFYVADGYGLGGNTNRSPGLVDIFVRNRFKVNDKMLLTLDLHEFYTGSKVVSTEATPLNVTDSSRLGTEVDLVLNYALVKNVNLEAGYSTIFATDKLNLLKGPAMDKKNQGQWAYLMFNFTPDFLTKTEKK